jgi:hypothetical protein
MKRLAIVAILGTLLTAPALAQQTPPLGGPGQGPPLEMHQRMEQARSDARAQALKALSTYHLTKIQGILARVKSGQITDARAAAGQIDDILSGTEAQAILTARDDFMGEMHRSRPVRDHRRFDDAHADRGPSTGPLGAPPREFAEGRGGPSSKVARRHPDHAMRNDAGLAFLMLNLDRAQMHSLFANR